MNPETGELFTKQMRWFNYETMIALLRDFLLTRIWDRRRIVIVVDNVPWHRKALRLIMSEEEYSDISSRIEAKLSSLCQVKYKS